MRFSDEEMLAVLRLQWIVYGPSGTGRWYAAAREPDRMYVANAPSPEELAIKLRYAQRGPAWWADRRLRGGCDDLDVAVAVAGYSGTRETTPVPDGDCIGLCLVVSRAGWCYLRIRDADGSWGRCAPSLAALAGLRG